MHACMHACTHTHTHISRFDASKLVNNNCLTTDSAERLVITS